MLKQTSWTARVIACCALAWQPSSALAQDEDTQLWVYAIATGDVGDALELTVDASSRWRENRRGDEQQTLRFNLMKEVGEGISIGGGAGVFEAGGATELRPHQQLGLEFGAFSARSRLEQRFFDGAERMELRFRQRVRLFQPITGGIEASVDGEFLNILQTRNRGPDQARDQWRGRVTLSAELGNVFFIDSSYI